MLARRFSFHILVADGDPMTVLPTRIGYEPAQSGHVFACLADGDVLVGAL